MMLVLLQRSVKEGQTHAAAGAAMPASCEHMKAAGARTSAGMEAWDM